MKSRSGLDQASVGIIHRAACLTESEGQVLEQGQDDVRPVRDSILERVEHGVNSFVPLARERYEM